MIALVMLCAFSIFAGGLMVAAVLNALARHCARAVVAQEGRKRAASIALAWSGACDGVG